MIYYKKFASCFLVKGYCRSTIYDLDRRDVWSIDNKTCEVLNNDIISEKSLHTLPLEIVEDLFEKEVIFPCSLGDAQLFPPINTERITPFQVVSSIIDVEHYSDYDICKVINQLSELGCRTLQIRFLSFIELIRIDEVLSFIIGNNIRSAELIMHFENIDIEELTKKYKMVTNITMYNAPKNDLIQINGCSIIFTTEDYCGVEQCGIIEPNYFVCNRDLFFESLNYNSCLNRKVSIDSLGNIKNCPSCTHSFGNIQDTDLKQAMEHYDFKKFWKVTKDQIDVCKDCEFRHMCTDCRAYIKDPSSIFSQPKKCTYNPYIAKWEGELGFVPIEECGKFSKDNRYIVNVKKVEKLNKKLLSD